MKPGFDKKVIVIGGDHHNTLAVVRCLGKMHCNQFLLVHSNQKDDDSICILRSKYIIGKTSCVSSSEEAIVQWLMDYASEEKTILFPCSDLAAYTIDANYDKLCDSYILPGFKDKPGEVVRLMDKWEQSEWAQEHGIPMAETWKLKKAEQFEIPDDMVYPCIVKPEVSAFGSKGDITICADCDALQTALEQFVELGYTQLVCQRFLRKKYEACAYGCIVDEYECCAGGMIEKIREFPPGGGGSLTYAKFIDEPSVCILRDKILDWLFKSGYRGQYDVELFVCEEGVYLNEINFRHSGNGYALVKNGVYAPYIWCVSVAGADIGKKMKFRVKTGKHHMDEIVDLQQIKCGNISVVKWIRDCFRTSAFAKWDMADIKCTMAYYMPLIKRTTRKFFGKGR